jgi:hypothetical protein
MNRPVYLTHEQLVSVLRDIIIEIGELRADYRGVFDSSGPLEAPRYFRVCPHRPGGVNRG